jgi:hypothetical protein
MFSYYLAHLKIRVSWVARLFAPLRSVHSFRIGYSAVLLCCFIFPLILLLHSENNIASAQVPTQTATPRPPLFPSATPQPTLDYSCNGQQPTGYGTVTPDAFWSMNCSQCLTPISPTGTPQPESTFTYAMTQTAQVVTPTSTIAPTPTATPTNLEPIYCGAGFFHCEQITMYHIRITSPNTQWIGYTSHGVTYDGIGYVVVTVSDNGLGLGVQTYDFHSTPPKPVTATDVALGQYFLYDSYFFIDNDGGKHWQIHAGIYEFTINFANTLGFELSNEGGGTNAVVIANTIIVDIYSYPPNLTIPTPTPTASLGYCDAIIPDTTNDDVDICAEGIFCLPDVTIGNTHCPIDFDSINIPLSVFGFTDVNIPSISVCFVQLYFGTITAWGVEIDIDWIVYVMAASWILHRLLAS